MYYYHLGGKDHFPADREAAEKALSVVPSGRELARANRAFLVRAVKHLAGQGIDQFIDVGTGLPTSPNVHEVARSVIPDARVVYVDNDRCKPGCAHADDLYSVVPTHCGRGADEVGGGSPKRLVKIRPLFPS